MINASFYQKIESIQYNTCLATTGAIGGSSREKNLSRAGFEITPTLTMVLKTMLLL